MPAAATCVRGIPASSGRRKRNPPPLGRYKPLTAVQQTGLARAVGSDQGYQLALTYPKVNAVEHDQTAKVKLEALDIQPGHGADTR